MRIPGIRRLDWIVTAACLALIAYFGLQAFVSPGGYQRLHLQQNELAKKQAELSALQQQLALLESRTASLRPESLDPDLLDEMARKELGLAGQNDLVVLLPKAIPQ